jgi:hypothetical protein
LTFHLPHLLTRTTSNERLSHKSLPKSRDRRTAPVCTLPPDIASARGLAGPEWKPIGRAHHRAG